jgi:DNA-directed RNA polymerase, mitochondrial
VCCWRGLPEVFGRRRGVPFIHKSFEDFFALKLCAELARRDPVFLPSIEPLHPWTDWDVGGYWNKSTPISTTFVRDYHPDTKREVRRAFRDGTLKPHVDGVNTLQAVRWTINAAMLPVVKKFAGKVGKKINKHLRAEDIETAEELAGKTFYVPYNCDFRGRVYGVSNFNFQREDHVRALFLFADGIPITDAGTRWLEIHAANCFGETSKRPRQERLDWVSKNRDMIMRTAQDPAATVDWWRKADSPFSLVAASIELAAAWKVGPDYVTHLPICFDGTCSGAQHLAMMMADEVVGQMVNLVLSDAPQDVYQVIREGVIERVRADNSPCARWWLNRGITRRIVKRPAMTFSYGVTPGGMAKHIVDELDDSGSNYRDSDEWKQERKENWERARYLAEHVMAVSKHVLKKPSRAMDCIQEIARIRAKKGLPFWWRTLTGFPLE